MALNWIFFLIKEIIIIRDEKRNYNRLFFMIRNTDSPKESQGKYVYFKTAGTSSEPSGFGTAVLFISLSLRIYGLTHVLFLTSLFCLLYLHLGFFIISCIWSSKIQFIIKPVFLCLSVAPSSMRNMIGSAHVQVWPCQS